MTDKTTPDSPATEGCAPVPGSGLLPCPLCGGTAKITGASVFGGLLNNMSIICQTCQMETRRGQFEEREELIDFWNKRPLIAPNTPLSESDPAR